MTYGQVIVNCRLVQQYRCLQLVHAHGYGWMEFDAASSFHSKKGDHQIYRPSLPSIFSDSTLCIALHHDFDGPPTAPLPPPRGETYQRLQLPKLRGTAGEGGIRQKPQFGGVSSTRASCCNDFETDEIDGIKAGGV